VPPDSPRWISTAEKIYSRGRCYSNPFGPMPFDQGGALFHQPVAGAMQRLHVELLFTF
jgi:hypothetical protein